MDVKFPGSQIFEVREDAEFAKSACNGYIHLFLIMVRYIHGYKLLVIILQLAGGFSNTFDFHPENWRRFPFWRIFFRWVETTNQYTSIFDEVLCAKGIPLTMLKR